jgi:protoporphyrinogen/coproporphyrinogen III oxidase
MSDQRDAIIIGAGITGLVTAYELQKRGLNVLLLERDSEVGGVMRSERRDGYLLEWGPNSYLESEEADRLIQELDLDSKFVTADPKAPRFLYFRGALEPVPMNPIAFFSSRLLSLKGKLRIFAEPFMPARKSRDEESIASFIRRRIGAEAHDRLVAPFVSGIYAGNTEKLSMAASFPKLAELEDEYGSLIFGAIKSARRKRKEQPAKPQQPDGQKRAGKRLCTFIDGLGTLPQTIARRLDDSLINSCEATEITIGSDSPRYRVRFQRGGEVREFSTDRLILATPAPESARLIGSSLPGLATELAAIEYAPMAVVYLSFDQMMLGRPITGFGFLVPRNEGVRLLGSVWNSSLFPARSPEGQLLTTNFIGGAHDTGVVDLSDDQLAGIVSNELRSILRISAEAQVVGVRKIRRAIPQYNIGHVSRVARITEQERAQPGLHLAGNYLQGVSVPDCISRAIKLASTI